MPAELRHLLFPPTEVVNAVREYHRRFGTPLPAGSVVECGPEGAGAQEGAVRFRIVLASPPAKGAAPGRSVEDVRREMVIESHVLVAALILYCRDQRIPLPATATKSLQRFGNQVCLIATIGAKHDKLPSLQLTYS